MNKLAFTLATVAALSLSTAVFAQTSSPASTPKAVQSTQSKTHVTKHAKKHRYARHYASHKGKKVVKHAPTAKTVRTKAAS
jgi:hypothetical protein